MTGLYILIFTILTGFIGGLLYLVYLPFKTRLIKSGKLSKKQSRRINWSYLGFMVLIGILLFYFRDYRTSSKERLENISNIKLPSDYTVIKDEYQDMLQDYCINYEIQFDKNDLKELIQNIKKSKYYNSKSVHNDAWQESDFIDSDSLKAVWLKSPKGYDFNCIKERLTFSIELDTLKNKLMYNECAD